ncbi:MAG: cation:proton antiporter [Methylotetracoccus sp.]
MNATLALESVLTDTLVQLSVILLAARICGTIARWLGQPRAMGEIVAGLLLGPSLFGKIAPEQSVAIFHSGLSEPMTVISQIGLILLMFQIGMEFDFVHLRERRNRTAVFAITACGMLLPFAAGVGFALASASRLAPDIGTSGYALFMGAAFSITALPILGRIMLEFQLTRTRLGVVTIAAAALTDAVGWLCLASIAAVVTSGFDPQVFASRFALLIGYCVVCWLLVRPLLRALARTLSRRTGEPLPPSLLAILLACVFLSATLTSALGIFAIFGGFVIGVLLYDQENLVAAWQRHVGRFVEVFFLPIFFTYTGLRTDLGQLQSAESWAWCLGLVATACLAKMAGSYLAARFSGISVNESRLVAVMMNTRGLMELIVVNLGFQLGVIPREVFTMLVLMALIATILTAPLLRRGLIGTDVALPHRVDV